MAWQPVAPWPGRAVRVLTWVFGSFTPMNLDAGANVTYF
jgi:hypothetical protein